MNNNDALIKEVRDAYTWIRTNNQSIPDEVLDLMKDAAILSLQSQQGVSAPLQEEDEEKFIKRHLGAIKDWREAALKGFEQDKVEPLKEDKPILTTEQILNKYYHYKNSMKAFTPSFEAIQHWMEEYHAQFKSVEPLYNVVDEYPDQKDYDTEEAFFNACKKARIEKFLTKYPVQSSPNIKGEERICGATCGCKEDLSDCQFENKDVEEAAEAMFPTVVIDITYDDSRGRQYNSQQLKNREIFKAGAEYILSLQQSSKNS